MDEARHTAIDDTVRTLTTALDDLAVLATEFVKIIPDDQLADEIKARFVRVYAAIGVVGSVLLVIDAQDSDTHDLPSAVMGLKALSDFRAATRVIEGTTDDILLADDAEDEMIVFVLADDGTLDTL